MDRKALIVGAGPTGLAMALWLERLGVAFRIIDRNDGPGQESRALAVQARTLEFYAQVAFADIAIAHGVPLAALNLWARGDRAAHVVFGDMGRGMSPFPYALILAQDQHERLLVEELARRGVHIERGIELVGYEEHGNRVIARTRHHGGQEEIGEYSWVVGCDGAHSTVRETLRIGFPGGTYEHLFYVADVEATGPVVNGELHVALDESDLLAVFPLHARNNVRFVGTIRAEAEHAERNIGWDDVSQGILKRLHIDVVRVNWFSTYRVHHRVASRFRVGRAFLLGDAAHIHSPVGGQGMNTGIGDAVNLAWKLAMVMNGRAEERLLDTYGTERIAFAQRLVATTDRAFTFVSSAGPVARLVRVDLVPHVVPAVFAHDAARRYLFRTISQILVHYPDSPLSEGHAGDVRGGDRLPWTGRNFEPLALLDWQVHVYGSAPASLLETCRRMSLSVQVFPWDGGAQSAGFARDAMYLVRPDGYVALADPAADAGRLDEYLRDHGLRAR